MLGKIDDSPQVNQSMGIKTNAEKLNQRQHKNFTWFPQCEVRPRDRNPIPLSTVKFPNDYKRDTNGLTNHP